MISKIVEKLLSRINRNKRTVAVIGDYIQDVWVYGGVEDCQDGCKKFKEDQITKTIGGAGNAELSINKWETKTLLFTDMTRPSIKTRFVDYFSNETEKIVMRHDRDAKMYTPQLHVYDNIIKGLKGTSAVLLSDYDKGFLTPDFIKRVSDFCRDNNIFCIADCKRSPQTYNGCILKCNDDYLRKYNYILPGKYNGNLIVTYGGAQPNIFYNSEMSMGLGYQLPSIGCVNHIGAGDCFAAHLALGLAYDLGMRDSVRLAHSAGRVYVQHRHNRAPHPEEIANDGYGFNE